MTKNKKIFAVLLALVMVFTLAACGGNTTSSSEAPASETSTEAPASSEAPAASSEAEPASEEPAAGKATGPINVVSREDGSGTRGAFVEITGVMEDDVDNTVATAAIQSSTNEVLTYVQSDPASIGYISLGSMEDSVKALKVDGAEATEEAIVDGSYPVSRPFNVVYKEDKISDTVKDFLAFIMSKEGQALTAEAHIIAADSAAQPYEAGEGIEGTIRIQGSTSVTDYMEVLMEEYQKLQPNVKFDFTSNGSGAGITAAIEDNADIGMASREIKQEETDQGITTLKIAIDGIAVIVAKDNPAEEITLEQIKQVYTGEITTWDEL